MWNRDRNEKEDEEAMDRSDTSTDASAKAGRRDRTASGGRQAIIGKSITIDGELTGSEDLTIQGNVEGSVDLNDHALTVGPDGKVEADIVARVITVEGHVIGDLDADDQIVLKGTARVEGDLSAPRVNLEDGSYFRGAVDMGEKKSASGGGGERSSSSASGASSFSSPSSSKSKKDDGSKRGDDAEDAEADDAA